MFITDPYLFNYLVTFIVGDVRELRRRMIVKKISLKISPRLIIDYKKYQELSIVNTFTYKLLKEYQKYVYLYWRLLLQSNFFVDVCHLCIRLGILDNKGQCIIANSMTHFFSITNGYDSIEILSYHRGAGDYFKYSKCTWDFKNKKLLVRYFYNEYLLSPVFEVSDVGSKLPQTCKEYITHIFFNNDRNYINNIKSLETRCY